MSFSDHKITAFTHRIADLPDQPNLPADELKERFDSSPEELRESVNGICDEADRLEERVSGIIAETFGDSIDKSMLSDELQDELDAKATQTALSAAVDTLEAANAAETAAREEADGALDTRLTSAETALPEKVGIYCGTYTGNGSSTRSINLGFRPKAVILTNSDKMSNHGGFVYMAGDGHDTGAVQITNTGFAIAMQNGGYATNYESTPYFYVAFR